MEVNKEVSPLGYLKMAKYGFLRMVEPISWKTVLRRGYRDSM
jgi:hypothetical protein